jgi:hypothetical protein
MQAIARRDTGVSAARRTGLVRQSADVIGDDGPDVQRARREVRAAGDLAAPDLVDPAAVAVLRKRWLGRFLMTGSRRPCGIWRVSIHLRGLARRLGSASRGRPRGGHYCSVPEPSEPVVLPDDVMRVLGEARALSALS